jgi:hypothetical protein
MRHHHWLRIDKPAMWSLGCTLTSFGTCGRRMMILRKSRLQVQPMLLMAPRLIILCLRNISIICILRRLGSIRLLDSVWRLSGYRDLKIGQSRKLGRAELFVATIVSQLAASEHLTAVCKQALQASTSKAVSGCHEFARKSRQDQRGVPVIGPISQLKDHARTFRIAQACVPTPCDRRRKLNV